MQPVKPAPAKFIVRGFDSPKLFRRDCLIRLRELYKEIAQLEESMRKLKASAEAREKEMKRHGEVLDRYTGFKR